MNIDELKFEDDVTLMRELNEGDLYLSKGNNVHCYVGSLENDKHTLRDVKTEKEWIVPNGDFPVFKQIK